MSSDALRKECEELLKKLLRPQDEASVVERLDELEAFAQCMKQEGERKAFAEEVLEKWHLNETMQDFEDWCRGRACPCRGGIPMTPCPKCKGRATKLFSITTGKTTCQQCGHAYREVSR